MINGDVNSQGLLAVWLSLDYTLVRDNVGLLTTGTAAA